MNAWLGSERLASTPTGGLYDASAYGPFGESYAQTGSDPRFTGQIAAIATGSYDFLMREYSPTQSRWWTPDPSAIAAVNPGDPQTWNAYAYVAGTPLEATDPTGQFAIIPDPFGGLVAAIWNLANDLGIVTQQKGCGARLNRPGGHAHLLATNFDVNGRRHGRFEEVNWGDCQPGTSHPTGPVLPTSPQPKTPPTSPRPTDPCQHGWGCGGYLGGIAEAGIAAGGASAQADAGFGLFRDQAAGPTVGGFASGGHAAYWLATGSGSPSQGASSMSVVGLYAGAGGGVFITNAGSAGALAGPFLTFSASLGLAEKVSFQLAVGAHGIWIGSLSWGPGAGASGSGYLTETVTTGGSCRW